MLPKPGYASTGVVEQCLAPVRLLHSASALRYQLTWERFQHRLGTGWLVGGWLHWKLSVLTVGFVPLLWKQPRPYHGTMEPKDDFHVYIMCNVYTNMGNELHAIPFLIFNYFTQNQMDKRYTYLWIQETEHYTSTCKNYRKWLQLLHYLYHHPITLTAGKSGWMWTRQARYKITWLSWKFRQPRNTFCFSVFCLSVTPWRPLRLIMVLRSALKYFWMSQCSWAISFGTSNGCFPPFACCLSSSSWMTST